MADDEKPPGGGNRVFTREESVGAFGPHPYAHKGDEIRARIRNGRRAKWWLDMPDYPKPRPPKD